MRVIGIDPGLATTGYGIVDKRGSGLTSVAAGAVRTDARTAAAESQFATDSCASAAWNGSVV